MCKDPGKASIKGQLSLQNIYGQDEMTLVVEKVAPSSTMES